jgi:hypothetical protein
MTWEIREYPAISADTYLRKTFSLALKSDFEISAPSLLFYKEVDIK